jgi:hypothetical protein
MIRKVVFGLGVLLLTVLLAPGTTSAQVNVGPVTCTTSGCSVVSVKPYVDAFCGSAHDDYYGDFTGCRLRVRPASISCGEGRRVNASGDAYAFKGCLNGTPSSELLLAGCEYRSSPTSGRSRYCGTLYGNGCGSGDRTADGGSRSQYGYCGSLAGAVNCGKGYDYYGAPFHTCAVSVTNTALCWHDFGDPPAPTPERPYPYHWTGCYTSLYPLNPVVGCIDGYEPGPGDETVRASYCTVQVGQTICRYDRLSGDFGCDPAVTGRRSKAPFS